ncbi:MAG: hypothetical protein ABI581_00185 [Sediminibacterium sp.]
MKKIHQNATRIFCQLLSKLGEHTKCKLEPKGFMPIVIEQLEENIQTPMGKGKLISVAFYHQQDEKTLHDPEICFIVVDNRTDCKQYDKISIYPQLYRQDSLSLYEESICLAAGKITSCKPVWQAGHIKFANQWLQDLKQLGFLKTIPNYLYQLL